MKKVLLNVLFSVFLLFSCKNNEFDVDNLLSYLLYNSSSKNRVITFNSNDGTESPLIIKQFFYGGNSQNLKTVAELGFENLGHEFMGWARSKDSAEPEYMDGQILMPNEDITLYAVWEFPLSSIELIGKPCFDVDNVFFADSIVSDYGLTLKAVYSNSSSKTVSSSGKIMSPVRNTPGNVTIVYTDGEITKTTELKGSYYIAASDSLTQKVVLSGSVEVSLNDEIKKYDLIKFGDFPQTIAGTEITYSTKPVYDNWYLGSDGYFYERLKARNGPSSVSIPRFSDGTWFDTGKEYYFKVEPIEWRVLDNEFDHDCDKSTNTQKLLLVERMITANISFFESYETRVLGDKTIFQNNYKYSNIRAYLNGLENQFVADGGSTNNSSIDWSNKGFLQKAFTKPAQNLISTSLVRNSSTTTNPDSDSNLWNEGINDYTCEDTEDKIFLLSVQEVTKTTYGFPEHKIDNIQSIRTKIPTDYAQASYAFHYNLSGGNWFLRSPVYDESGNIFIVDYQSNVTKSYNDSSNGICPAMSISF